MKILTLIITLCSLSFVNPALADLYLEMAFEGGGDDLIGTNTGDDISAGGGIKFAIGVQNPVNYAGNASIRLSLGYLFDDIDAANGDAEIETFTFDALYAVNSGPHTFGFGGTLHIEPEYRDNVIGFPRERIQFDDALGVLLQYGYHFTHGLELGVRLSSLDYEAGNTSYDAGGFGIFISNGF